MAHLRRTRNSNLDDTTYLLTLIVIMFQNKSYCLQRTVHPSIPVQANINIISHSKEDHYLHWDVLAMILLCLYLPCSQALELNFIFKQSKDVSYKILHSIFEIVSELVGSTSTELNGPGDWSKTTFKTIWQGLA